MHAYKPVLDHIEKIWESLVRSQPDDAGTLIGLPRPYVVPSADGMFQEMYYWDSFFISLGLVGTPREQLVVDMAENMAYLLERFGVIPNGSRYYFLSRSQPPFFTQQVLLAWAIKERRREPGRRAWLAKMVRLAEAEHATVWMGTAQPHSRQIHRGLSRYFDINHIDLLASCESGWDHSNRCDDRWLEHLPIDLNAILAVYEADLVRAHTILGNVEAASTWRAAKDQRIKTVRSLLWDADLGCYLDYDVTGKVRNPTPSLAMFYALWAGIATKAQAARMVREWFPKFLRRGGLVTSLKAKRGRQWAYPNGWAPLQWIAVEGLRAYGFHREATEVMRRWCDATAQVFDATGEMWEKLNVVTATERSEEGLYGAITGFGWSNAVFSLFARELASASG
jgi:alpha,alpha-trehalase